MPMKYARLTEPLVRENGALRPASWDEALDRAADGIPGPRRAARPGHLRHVQLLEGDERGQLRSRRSSLGSPSARNNIDSCNRT